MQLEENRDFVVVGSGAGGLTAALRARAAGADVVVLEKEALLGGNTALSGGSMWIPGNALLREAGVEDSLDAALIYLDACVGDAGPATSRARKQAYLDEGPALVDFLRGLGIPFNRVAGYADYYAELQGAHAGGRALQVDAFDLGLLGAWESRVPNYAPIVGYVQEFPQITFALRTWRGFTTALRVAARTVWGRKIRGRNLAANGAALIGRLLAAALRAGVDVRPSTPLLDFVVADGRVVGVRTGGESGARTILARHGVLVASGGFARNLELRRRYGRQPPSTDWTFANPGETGDVIERVMAQGGATDLMDEGIWIPMAKSPLGPMYLEYERGKPHALIVDGSAQRYMDEGTDYMGAGQAMWERHRTVPAIPSWLIFDARHRARYIFGLQLPGRTPQSWLDSGFMKRADTLEGLAAACGLDAAALRATVERFNGFARAGVDRDFHRGETLFSKRAGDPTHRPNPALGTIERAPFHAVAAWPGDLGTFGGILTDEHARVQRADGSVIAGLYATGNATAPVMGRVYPCTGASIASTMIFGSLAARHALESRADVRSAARAAALE